MRLIFIALFFIFGCSKKVTDTASTTVTLGSDQMLFNGSISSGPSQIYQSKTDGTGVIALTSGTGYEYWWPRPSPDRTKMVFYRAPQGTNEDYAQADLMLYDFTTKTQSVLRAKNSSGWTLQAHADWSPDGKELVTCGTGGGVVQVFVLNSQTGVINRQLTSTGGWNCDPSYSPDGTKIVFNRCAAASCHSTFGALDIYTMSSVDGSGLVALTLPDSKDDYDPYYSPSGNEIAWLHQVNNTAWSGAGVWSIKKMTSLGASQIFLINDTNINSKPAWNLDGTRILFHRMAPLEVVKYRLFSMAADGTGLLEATPFGPATGAAVGSLSYPQN